MYILRKMPKNGVSNSNSTLKYGLLEYLCLKRPGWRSVTWCNVFFHWQHEWLRYQIINHSWNSLKHTKKFYPKMNCPKNLSPHKPLNFIKSMKNCLEAKNVVDAVVVLKHQMWELSLDVLYCFIDNMNDYAYQIMHLSWYYRKHTMKFSKTRMIMQYQITH